MIPTPPNTELLKCLGKGGMGEVWLAEQTSLKRLVAVKFIRADMSSETALRRFQQEAQLAGKLHHPHVVTVYDYGIVEGTPYLITEYVEGQNLKEAHRGAVMDTERARVVFADLAGALAAAHAAGIIHRDVKPENILVSRHTGVVKLADFGLARDADSSLTESQVIVGSVHIIAPEVWQGQRAGPAADMYALGATLFWSLLGSYPFTAETQHGLMHKTVNEPLPRRRLQGVADEQIISLVMSLLEKNPRKRPSAQRVYEELSGTAGIDSETQTLLNGDVRPVSKKWRYVTLIVLICMVALFLIIVLVKNDESDEGHAPPVVAVHVAPLQEIDAENTDTQPESLPSREKSESVFLNIKTETRWWDGSARVSITAVPNNIELSAVQGIFWSFDGQTWHESDPEKAVTNALTGERYPSMQWLLPFYDNPGKQTIYLKYKDTWGAWSAVQKWFFDVPANPALMQSKKALQAWLAIPHKKLIFTYHSLHGIRYKFKPTLPRPLADHPVSVSIGNIIERSDNSWYRMKALFPEGDYEMRFTLYALDGTNVTVQAPVLFDRSVPKTETFLTVVEE